MVSYGFSRGTDIVLGVVNGSGIGGMDATRTFDPDRFKNPFLRISQDVIKGVRVGAYAYSGREGPDDTLNYDVGCRPRSDALGRAPRA